MELIVPTPPGGNGWDREPTTKRRIWCAQKRRGRALMALEAALGSRDRAVAT
jgi:hypothetical protein